MSIVAEIVARLIAAGTPADIAAVAVTEAFAAGAVGRQSADNPVDSATEKRRAYDRERQRKIRELHRQSADNPPTSEPALTLTSSPQIEASKEGKKVRARKHPLSADWQPKPAHFDAAEKLKIARPAVESKAEDMRIWAGSTGALKLDWDLTFHGFLRRDAPKFVNGHTPRPGSKEDTRERTVNALRCLDPFARSDDDQRGESPGAPLPRELPFVKSA